MRRSRRPARSWTSRSTSCPRASTPSRRERFLARVSLLACRSPSRSKSICLGLKAMVSGAPDPTKWQRSSVDLVLKGEDQPDLSGMAAGSPSRPIEEGAYVAYRVDGGPLQKVRGAEAPIAVADKASTPSRTTRSTSPATSRRPRPPSSRSTGTNPTTNATSDAVDPTAWQRESVSVTRSTATTGRVGPEWTRARGGPDRLRRVPGLSPRHGQCRAGTWAVCHVPSRRRR